MLDKLLKGNFLAGKKTYVVLWGGIVVTWLGVLTGTDLACTWQGGTTCVAPDVSAAIQMTWLAVSGIFIRKGVGG